MSLLKVIPLGGAGEIGKNCTVVELGDEMILVDCGISFPHEEHHGVDIVIPDFTYLIENKEKLKGIFITHAHEDHIGALAYLLPEVDCPIFASPLAEAFIRTRLEERARIRDPRIAPLHEGKNVELGGFKVEPIRVTHSIPETMALAIHTEFGAILFTADFKFDSNPVDNKMSNLKRLAELGEEGVLLLLSDSTNVDREGWSVSEGSIKQGLHNVMAEAAGRVFVTMFSSNIHRMQQICDASKELGRKVCIAGRRMEQTFQMCRRMGYLNVKDDLIISTDELSRYQHNELTIIVTGSQGEFRAALSQMSRAEYSRIKIIPGDLVVYSARPIPGNEGSIWRTVNRLVKLGAHVHIDEKSPVHASGHGSKEEIRLMYRLTKPFYVAPVHGEPRHQQLFLDLLDECQHPAHRRFVISNGDTLCMDESRAWLGDPVIHGNVYLDQNGNHKVSEEIIRQRSGLATDGVFVLSVILDSKSGSLEGRPTVQTHGFIASESQLEDLMDDICSAVAGMKPSELKNPQIFRANLEDYARRSIWRKVKQSPVVISIITPA